MAAFAPAETRPRRWRRALPSVMIGSMLAGTAESPGEVFLYQGRSYKSYRGMGSVGAIGARQRRPQYFQQDVSAMKLVPEGIEGQVPDSRARHPDVVHQLVRGSRRRWAIPARPRSKTCKKARKVFVRITNCGAFPKVTSMMSLSPERLPNLSNPLGLFRDPRRPRSGGNRVARLRSSRPRAGKARLPDRIIAEYFRARRYAGSERSPRGPRSGFTNVDPPVAAPVPQKRACGDACAGRWQDPAIAALFDGSPHGPAQ